MSNKTEEALDLPHGNCIMGDECGNLSALRDHYQARPTFEGDEAEVRENLCNVMLDAALIPYVKDTANQALALLYAKDAEIAFRIQVEEGMQASIRAWRTERDEALARAERAEQALAIAQNEAEHMRATAISNAQERNAAERALADRDAAIGQMFSGKCLCQCGCCDHWRASLKRFLPAPDLAERIEGLVEELRTIVRCTRHEDDALEFLTNNYDAILAALKEVNSHDRT